MVTVAEMRAETALNTGWSTAEDEVALLHAEMDAMESKNKT